MANETQINKQAVKENAYEVLSKYTDALVKSYSYYMKEHPRSGEHMEQLGIKLKQIFKDLIMDNKLPNQNAPTAEEAAKSVARDDILPEKKEPERQRVDG